jgi:hypothetical protein
MSSYKPKIPKEYDLVFEQEGKYIKHCRAWFTLENGKDGKPFRMVCQNVVDNFVLVEKNISPVYIRCTEEEAKRNKNSFFMYLDQFDTCEDSWWIPEKLNS